MRSINEDMCDRAAEKVKKLIKDFGKTYTIIKWGYYFLNLGRELRVLLNEGSDELLLWVNVLLISDLLALDISHGEVNCSLNNGVPFFLIRGVNAIPVINPPICAK